MISIAINLDTRPGFLEQKTEQGTMLNGARSLDFFTEGIINKVRFFEGHDVETTVFIDVHDALPKETQDWLLEQQSSGLIDNLAFNRHTEQYLGSYYAKFNDLNFLNAMILTRGKYLVHFDGDMAAFIKDRSLVNEWLEWLDDGKYDYICYPSQHSPGPAVDGRYKSYWWASTRMFLCRRDIVDYTEILNCLRDSDYLYAKYGVDGEPRNPWLEHVLGLMAGNQGRVLYPPIEPNRYLIFAWSRYYSGVLRRLNEWPYEKVVEYVNKISYPCDVAAQEIK